MKLYFQNSKGQERLIAEIDNEKQAIKKINEFCAERDFTIYYIRTWEVEGRKKYDVGSHSEFFFLDME